MLFYKYTIRTVKSQLNAELGERKLRGKSEFYCTEEGKLPGTENIVSIK